MDASGGRRSMGQGTPPVQSGRRIRCETSLEVRWSLPGCDLQNTQKRKSGLSTLVSLSNNNHKSKSKPQATGFSVRHLQESSVITLEG